MNNSQNSLQNVAVSRTVQDDHHESLQMQSLQKLQTSLSHRPAFTETNRAKHQDSTQSQI